MSSSSYVPSSEQHLIFGPSEEQKESVWVSIKYSLDYSLGLNGQEDLTLQLEHGIQQNFLLGLHEGKGQRAR